MGGLTSVDIGLLLALGVLWAAGLETRTVGIVLIFVALARWLPSGAPEENNAAHDTDAVQKCPSPAAGRTRLQGTVVPSTGLLDFQEGDVHVFDNENCTCKFHILYRPTDDPAADAAGDYPWAAHFGGKKRLWEIRWQLTVKRAPRRPLVFGLELSRYMPVSGWARRIQAMTVATLRGVVGEDLYHSCGDDPKTVHGEAERPVFMMPLWAFDQIIVSEPGEEPDIRNIASLGTLRTSNRVEFIRRFSTLELEPGKVYTFAFWCISRFVDVVRWRMLGVVPKGVNFNTFCGRPPVHIVIYEVEEDPSGREKRHLQSRKTYYFNLALWSTRDPPAPDALRALVPDALRGPGQAREDAGRGAAHGWCC
eukprot:CAMPEP_0175530580 /NCGR_PEP_ID=MMETSP0096-20121207/21733_1 /TAXON_ID=311494 /ORGANISM="Alexandrium monilatum, Strain CCMP3105" /LENGTH=364 /DNA_ID=CAMNT_0016833303 /DNA_START=24 /DNA_END=1115 /DNA_ORIENTATION=+